MFTPVEEGLVIEGWVAKHAVLPVLTEPVTRSFDDGSGYALAAGVALTAMTDARLAEAPTFPVKLSDTAIGLTFDPMDAPPPALAPLPESEQLACIGGRGREEVLPFAELKERWADARVDELPPPCAPSGPATMGGEDWTIAEERWFPSDHRPFEGPAVRVGERTFVEARLPSGGVFRVVLSGASLHPAPSFVLAYGSYPPGTTIREGARVFYPDGRPAGRALREITVRDTRAASTEVQVTETRQCFSRHYLDSLICVTPTDLVAPPKR